MLRFLDRAFPWLLLTPAVLPLIYIGGVLYPYLLPKVLIFYALSLLSIGAFLILAAHGRKFFYERLSFRPAWVPAILVLLAYIASLAGIGFYHSFWSIFARGDGLLMLTLAAVDFYLILISADERFAARLQSLVAGTASAVALYGILEWLSSGGRIESTIGNAAFLAGYLGIALFITISAARRTLSRGWRRTWYAGAILQAIAIILTATRGSILALAVALAVYLVWQGVKGSPRARRWSLGTLATVALVLGLGFAFRADLAQVPFAPIARFASISTADIDISTRLFTWRNMAQEFLKRPLLGYGAEHIDYVYNQFYDPTKGTEDWLDRSHNAYLDYSIQYGIFGALLYLALIGAFFWYARGPYRLLIIVYAVGNFFVFDTISSFWLLLAAFALVVAARSPATLEASPPLFRGARAAFSVLAGILGLLIIPVSILPAIAGYDFAEGYKYQLTDPAQSASYFSSGFALHTYGDLDYGYQVGAAYSDVQARALTGSQKQTAYDTAYNLLKANYDRYPYDARTALNLAQVMSLAPTPVDASALEGVLARARDLSPKRPQTWYLLGNLYIAEANNYPVGSSARLQSYQQALAVLTEYEALVPALSETHYVLADLYQALGDARAAASEAQMGKADYVSSLETAKRAAGYYEYMKDWPDAEFFLSEVVRLDSVDLASDYDLAKVTYLAGDPAGADAIVQDLRAKDPSLVASDPAFLAAITQYEKSR